MIKRFVSSFLLLLFACSNPENELYGLYRIKGGGGYSEILEISKSNKVKDLIWQDLGGTWSGNYGEYKKADDTLIISTHYPISSDTHFVRIKRLRILKKNDIIALVDIDSEVNYENIEEYIERNEITGKPYWGNTCFIKFSPLNSDFIDSLNVDWADATKQCSIGIPFPPPPPRPVIREGHIDSTELSLDSLLENH